MEVIASFILPPTFPPEMVPDEIGRFMLSLVGKPLSEAVALADEEGLEPRTGPLPGRPAGSEFREFSVYVGGMVIPFGCRVKTSGGPSVH